MEPSKLETVRIALTFTTIQITTTKLGPEDSRKKTAAVDRICAGAVGDRPAPSVDAKM